MRQKVVAGLVAGVMVSSLAACSSSGEPSARAKFEAALEKTLLGTAKSDKDREVAQCVINTTKNLSDADYAKIVEKENPTPDVIDAYRASIASCGATATTPAVP